MPRVLTHAVDEAAQQAPEGEAFRCGNTSITFGELAARSNQLAHWLKANGVRKGDRVGVHLQRSAESAVAVYGVMKAGAAYVPIDPFAPVAAVREIVVDCGIRHWVTHPPMARRFRALKQAGCELIAVDWAEVDRADASDLTDPAEDDLAYIIYTSGSTGVPKGIMHTHRSGASYARLVAATYDIQPEDRIGSHSPLHFDMSMLGLFAGPLTTATTIVIPEAHTKMPASLSSLMEAERISVWYSVPFALLQLLLRGALEQRDLSSLRWVLYAGEAFPPKQLHDLMQRWPKSRFSNIYGPAETNQCTHCHLVSVDPNEAVSIGQSWEETDTRIVDEELLIHSSTMMSGYWERPDLNAKAFVELDGRRYYRSGDMVRKDAEGNLHLIGRRDRQIKIRGHRVELDGVEVLANSHAGVEEAAVYPVAGADGSLELELVFAGPPSLEPRDLRNYLSAALPAYAVPARIHRVEDLPRTATGKIDRLALRHRSGDSPE